VVRFVRHGPVALAASHAEAAKGSAMAVTRLVRSAGEQVVERARLDELRPLAGCVIGSGGAGAVIAFAAEGWPTATAGQVRAATERLAFDWLAAAQAGRPRNTVECMMIGAAVLSSILDHLGATHIALGAEMASARTQDSG
jgi:hypothetical protein